LESSVASGHFQRPEFRIRYYGFIRELCGFAQSYQALNKLTFRLFLLLPGGSRHVRISRRDATQKSASVSYPSQIRQVRREIIIALKNQPRMLRVTCLYSPRSNGSTSFGMLFARRIALTPAWTNRPQERSTIGVATTSASDSFRGDDELWTMAAIAFLVFYSNSMIAPLIPALARGFGVRALDLKWLIPGFSMLYGTATLFYGLISDRFGRYPVLRVLLGFAAVITLSLSFATNAHQLVFLRLLSGAGTGGIVTIALSIIGDRYPYAVQGRPMGRMFGAIAAGMGLGSSLGPLLNPLFGWRNEVRILAFGFGTASYWISLRNQTKAVRRGTDDSLWDYALEYRCILDAPRGGRTLAFIFVNGTFHGGIFAWIGVLLASRYQLSEIGIGLVLLGYGLPDLLFGLVIGSWGDRYGRRYVVPLGFLWASGCALLLALRSTPLISALIITALSVGFDATHPLMSSITTSIDPKHRGQITGLATFANFVGMGIGALLFRRLMVPHFSAALACFGCVEFGAGVLALYAFRAEAPSTRQ